MASKNANDPNRIVALSAGTIVALGFAGWRIIDAIGIPGGGRSSPAPAVTSSAPATSSSSASPAASTAAPSAAPGPAAAAPTELAGALPPARAASEETLAVSADPFQSFRAPVETRPTAAQPDQHGRTRREVLTDRGPGPLPPAGGDPGVMGGPAVPAKAPSVPQLVGTLLGDNPSAVFKTDAGVRVVAQGGMLDTWKVVAVEHGKATLRSGSTLQYLTVNPLVGGIQTRPAATAEEPAFMERMAVMPGDMNPLERTPVSAPEKQAVPLPNPAPRPEMPVPAAPKPAPVSPGEPAPAPVAPAPQGGQEDPFAAPAAPGNAPAPTAPGSGS